MTTGSPTPGRDQFLDAVLDPAAILMQAVQLHQGGRTNEARSLYQTVLRLVPEQPDALHLLGVMALQAGRPSDAIAQIRRAIASNPGNAVYHGNLGVALQQIGQIQEARDSLEQAVALNPQYADALFNLGITLQTLGRLAEAVERYQQVLAVVPTHPSALRNLGNALHALGRHAEAVEAYRALLALGPADAGLLGSLGASLTALGRADEAIEAAEAAVKLAPADAGAWLNLGLALQLAGRNEAAVEPYRRALALRPDHVEGWQSLGRALNAVKRYDEAVESYRRALALIEPAAGATPAAPVEQAPAPATADHKPAASPSPSEPKPGRPRAARPVTVKARAVRPVVIPAPTRNSPDRDLRLSLLRDLGSALYVAERRVEATEVLKAIVDLLPNDAEALRNYGVTLCTSGAMEESAAVLKRVVDLAPGSSDYLSNYIYVLDMLESTSLQQAFEVRRTWNERHALPLAALSRPHANEADPARRLRIGYVSADFRRHSASTAFLTILERHDPAVVEVVCYSNNGYEDDVTERFKACASRWRPVGALSDAELADLIRADEIDVFVDLSGHSRGNRLLTFAQKPAPVQVTAWGYATGTGLDAMDAYFSDPTLVQPHEERFYAERVVHLPNVLCYTPPPALPSVTPLPASSRGHVTFGSYNRVVKITPAVLELWATILNAVPDSRLILKPSLQDTPATRERLVGPLTRLGIDPGRVDLLGTNPHYEHLAAFGQIDIQLDPFPHSGGVSTLDGLLMGIPCVTLLGERVSGRASASFLAALGLDDLVARTPAQYVEIAVRLAGDTARLAHERATLRDRLLTSPMGDAHQYTRAVERAYRVLWRDWCVARTTPNTAQGEPQAPRGDAAPEAIRSLHGRR